MSLKTLKEGEKRGKGRIFTISAPGAPGAPNSCAKRRIMFLGVELLLLVLRWVDI